MGTNVKILGVRIDNFSVSEIKAKISDVLAGDPGQKFAATLNPEILLKARRDEKYRAMLNAADYNLCDGFGVKLAGFLAGKKVGDRFSGADLALCLLKSADKNKLKVLVVAAKNSLSPPAEIERAVKQKHPNLSVKSEYYSGSQVFFENGIIKEAEVVFVNFGAPDQEEFIFENRNNFPNAKILVGVGGSFDYISGKIRRAPRWMRSAGLEWLWRFWQEPKRIKRILNAVVVFPAVFLLSEIKSNE